MASTALADADQIPRPRQRAAASTVVSTGASAVLVADACRSAALGFLAGTAEGWSKRELAEWLGVYETVAVRPDGVTARAPNADAAPLDAGRLDRLMSEVREQALDTMLALIDPDRGVHFACYAVATGMVTTYIDRDGTEGWAPVDLPRMGLLHRLLSLIAVDYLLRPSDFERLLRSAIPCTPNCEGAVRSVPEDRESMQADAACG